MDNPTDSAVNNILSQLKSLNVQPSLPPTAPGVTPENLEQYVIDRSSTLIDRSMSLLNDMSQTLSSAPDQANASALAELINATASAIETLNKVLINQKKIEASIHIKTIDVESKQANNERDNMTKLICTRSEMLRMLRESESVDAIDAETIEVDH